MVPDKPSVMDYMINNLQAFIFKCGRTQGILQSDNEDTLNALLKATAAKVGSMTVRHAPSYSSNSQGSVERLHRILLGQVRVVKAQVESNYSMTMSTEALSTTLDSTTRSMGGKSLRHPLSGYTPELNAAGEETTNEPSANLARHYFIFHHNTRNRRKRRNGSRRTKGTNSTETTTGLQIRLNKNRHLRHCWTRNYSRQRREGPCKILDNRRT